MDMEDSFKVACIQMDCVSGNVEANFQKAKSLLLKAVEKDAKLAILPELFNVGYDLKMLKSLNYNFSDTINEISEISNELGIYIAAGVLEKSEDKYYNSTVVFNNRGELIEKYRKINLFSLSDEKDIFTPGDEIKMFYLDNIKFGILICYDIRFPELSREYINNGCKALIVSSAFPFPRLDHWKTLLKSRGIENQVYIIAANRIGKDDGLQFLGNSTIIDPWGNILGILNEQKEDVLIHEIDLNKVNSVREFMPCIKDKKFLESIIK